jgi:hypothetical protein
VTSKLQAACLGKTASAIHKACCAKACIQSQLTCNKLRRMQIPHLPEQKKPGSRAGLTGVRRISVKDRFTMRQNGIYHGIPCWQSMNHAKTVMRRTEYAFREPKIMR